MQKSMQKRLATTGIYKSCGYQPILSSVQVKTTGIVLVLYLAM